MNTRISLEKLLGNPAFIGFLQQTMAHHHADPKNAIDYAEYPNPAAQGNLDKIKNQPAP